MNITYYTDPLCCWSWAMEEAWQSFLLEYRDEIQVTYKMGGLLPSWKSFHDQVNAIQRPVQMGPEWMHARHLSGADIDDRIWFFDPPASSFPACIAVKSAEIQSPELGAAYLRLAWNAVMRQRRNIAKKEVLLEIAEELGSPLNRDLFGKDLLSRGKDAFRADWQETKYKGIRRFPTFIFRNEGQQPLMLAGYQQLADLKRIFEKKTPA